MAHEVLRYRRNKIVWGFLMRLQKRFEKREGEIDGINRDELNEFLDGIEIDLLNESIADKIDGDLYNALWDLILDIRKDGDLIGDGNYIIGFHWNVPKVYEHKLLMRTPQKLAE